MEDIFEPVDDSLARMATVTSLLHHKFSYFFLTKTIFYLNKTPITATLVVTLLSLLILRCWAVSLVTARKIMKVILLEDVPKVGKKFEV